jgi:hypothetical protein
MADSPESTAQNILRGVAGGLTSVAPLTSGPWRVALTAIGGLAELVGDLLELGVEPHIVIAELRSVLPDRAAARARLKRLIDEKSKP